LALQVPQDPQDQTEIQVDQAPQDQVEQAGQDLLVPPDQPVAKAPQDYQGLQDRLALQVPMVIAVIQDPLDLLALQEQRDLLDLKVPQDYKDKPVIVEPLER
jgi:hypothetical protein